MRLYIKTKELKSMLALIDMTQKELAEKLNITQEWMSQLVRGHKPMSYKHLVPITCILGCHWTQIIREVEQL